jgi:VIT1/CCC1 family predicted Fe2+/Mn2+ transporter
LAKIVFDTKEAHANHPIPRHEGHKSHREKWLRATVLGADDGIVSTAGLMLGVAAAHSSKHVILTAGFAGLIAGALSMAAGEYVSVSSQRDSEKADLRMEALELKNFPEDELHELSDIYIKRGLDPSLAYQVAAQLQEHDALAAHARDELGIDHETLANPSQAAISSAISFASGAALPIIAELLSSGTASYVAIALTVSVALITLGFIGAQIGGGNRWRASLRVFVGGGLAMLIATLLGRLVGAAI